MRIKLVALFDLDVPVAEMVLGEDVVPEKDLPSSVDLALTEIVVPLGVTAGVISTKCKRIYKRKPHTEE